MRLKLIACEILYREFCAVIAHSANQVDAVFLTKGLHDIGQSGMTARLDETLAAVDETQYDAILFGYALCSNGLTGLTARNIPLVLPRAHDCITLLLGDRQRYLDYFHAHPGTFFASSGWLERGGDLSQLGPDAIQNKTGMNQSYEELAAKYGEENARFLYEQLSEMLQNYGRMTFIEMGIEPDDRFKRQAQSRAAAHDWAFEKLVGDMSLIRGLVDGDWDAQRFLVVPPGSKIVASFDEQIVKAEPAKEQAE